MIKNINELKDNVKKEVINKINNLKDGEMLLAKLDNNGSLLDIIISSKNLDLGKHFGFTRYSEAAGGEYVKRNELKQFIEKSKDNFVFDYSKAMNITRSKVKRDNNVVINEFIASMLNIKKGGKYTQNDIDELIDNDATIQEFETINNSIQEALLNGEMEKITSLGTNFKELKEKAETKKVEYNKLLNCDKPSNYTSDEINEMVNTLKTKFEKVNSKIIDFRKDNQINKISSMNIDDIIGGENE